MSPNQALAQLTALHNSTPPHMLHEALERLARTWRQETALPDRPALAEPLWQTGAQIPRIMAAKLLTQARINPDDDVWAMICTWCDECTDSITLNAVCRAGQKRLMARPERLAEIAVWRNAQTPWHYRAFWLMVTPFSRLPHPKGQEIAAQNRILAWAQEDGAKAPKPVALLSEQWLQNIDKHMNKINMKPT